SNFTKFEKEKISKIEKDLNELFGVNLGIGSIFKNDIEKFKAEYSLYSKLLKIKKPKEIYLINSCDKAALIAAAHSQSVLVNELQHGLNSNLDIILNFPYNSQGELH